MAFESGPWTRATFSPADAPPVDFNFTLAYVTSLHDRRIAFVETYYSIAGDEPTKRLRSGQVGRFELSHRGDEDPADHLVIPLGVLTCISQVVEVKEAVRATFVIAEVA